jgi:hypothetical protein
MSRERQGEDATEDDDGITPLQSSLHRATHFHDRGFQDHYQSDPTYLYIFADFICLVYVKGSYSVTFTQKVTYIFP